MTDPGWASRRPARTAGVLATAVGDELVLWNPFDRTSHVLNRTARQVWEALDGERTVDELASALAAAFGASLRTVRRDVRRLVGALAEAELVDGPEGRPLPAPAWPEAAPPASRLAPAHARAVQAHRWHTATAAYAAFDFRFAVHDETDLAARALVPTFAPLATEAPADHRYTIRERRGRLVLALDGRRLHAGSPGSIARHLVWHVNRLAVASVPDHLVVHAAALQVDGTTILLPAAMESGKSTLAAGLVARGWDYLSDEAVAIEPATGRLRPYPRAISLDRGSWPVLPELRPDDPELASGRLLGGWQVSPLAIRPASIGRPAPADLVVFPRYEAGRTATLEPIAPTDALVALLAQTFDFGPIGAPGLERLRRLAELPAHRLVHDDLDEAERTLRHAAGEARARSAAATGGAGSVGGR